MSAGGAGPGQDRTRAHRSPAPAARGERTALPRAARGQDPPCPVLAGPRDAVTMEGKDTTGAPGLEPRLAPSAPASWVV